MATATLIIERVQFADGSISESDMDDSEVPEDAKRVELEIDLEGGFSKYDPGRCSGPPEDCYPPEGGDLESMTATLGGEKFDLTDVEYERAEEKLRSSWEENDDYGRDRDDYEERDDDDRYDASYEP